MRSRYLLIVPLLALAAGLAGTDRPDADEAGFHHHAQSIRVASLGIEWDGKTKPCVVSSDNALGHNAEWTVRGLIDDWFGETRSATAPESPADRRDTQTAAGEGSDDPGAAVPLPRPDPDIASQKAVPGSRAQIDLSFAPLVKETAPAVVNVYAARAVPQRSSPFAGDPFFGQFFGQRRQQNRPRMEAALGSGVIVDPSGLVVTNNHVVENADEVKIALSDGQEFSTTVLLKDDTVDLAVLKIDSDRQFPTVPIANSDGLEIGDLVLAIGNPFGIGQTVTNGIVSALARNHIGVDDFGFFIQTDAAINPGNSGGALIDMQGRLVGVNTAIFSRSGGSNGIGFAIPSNMVGSFVRAAKAGGRFELPYAGASFTTVTPDIAEALGLKRPTGALVHQVAASGPAATAGLKVGDVVLAIDDFTVDTAEAVGYRLATAGVGRTAKLGVLRDGERLILQLSLEPAPETPPRDERTIAGENPFSGATVLNLSPRVDGELGFAREKTGVVVANVARGSIAQRVGLRPQDILVSLNDETIASTRNLQAILERDYRGWQFEIERNGRRFTQVIR